MFLLDTLKHPDISYQINAFRNWDRNAIPDSRGAAVFLLIYRNLERTTPRQLTYQECVEVLKKVKEYQVKYFGREDITLGDLQRLVRGNESFPMYGIPDVLTAEWGEQQHDGTIKVTGGDGYVMFIRFPKEGLPQIESLNM
jgi:hypothetical protein